MAEEESALRGVIVFLDKIGVYDVVLPFLLVFTIVFAILEKTKIFGTEEIEGKAYTKKNLNAMTAFVIAFFVVASTSLVRIISEATANITLLLILIIMFLLLIGSFFKEDEDVYLKEGAWRTTFMILILVGILLIFLDALDWLTKLGDWFSDVYTTDWFGAIVLIIVIVIIMILITRDRGGPPKKKKDEE